MAKMIDHASDPRRAQLREEIAAAGTNPTEVAYGINRSRDYVRDYLNGRKKDFSRDEWDAIQAFIKSKASPNLGAGNTVPLVGYVGAGAETHLFAEGQGPFDYVDAPEGATEQTVAVEIRGESLGTLFNQWLVFYDDVRDPPTETMLNKLCVVGLADGRVLIKRLERGQLEGRHNLISNTEPPIYDVTVTWAAKVRQMMPR